MNENKKRYSLQRIYFVSLLRKMEKEYYGNLNEKRVNNNKIFWKTVKPFLSDKIVSKEQITLVENDKIISEDSDVAQSLNSLNDCNGTLTHNHLVRKRTLNHLAKLASWIHSETRT